MKSLVGPGLAVGAIAVLLSVSCNGEISARGRAEDAFSLSTSFEGVETLRVRWRNGAIHIRIDGDATEIIATGTKVVTAENQEDAAAAIEEFAIVFEVSDSFPSRKTLRFDAPESNFSTVYQADVEVVVPGSVVIDAANDNGSVDIVGNNALSELQVDNGDVTVTDQRGDVSVAVGNGSVSVDSASGDVDVEVDNGAINVGADPGTNGLLHARTDVGAIDLAIPAGTPANVVLKGGVGGVNASFEGFELTEFSTAPTEITATLNGGGAEIIGEARVGEVSFSARPPG